MIRSRLRVSEKSIQSAVSALLQLDGWLVVHIENLYSEQRRKTYVEPGWPDLTCFRWEFPVLPVTMFSPTFKSVCQVLFIELKAEGGRLSNEQRIWHSAMRERGALTIIAGEDFGRDIESWLSWYRQSGLMRRKL